MADKKAEFLNCKEILERDILSNLYNIEQKNDALQRLTTLCIEYGKGEGIKEYKGMFSHITIMQTDTPNGITNALCSITNDILIKGAELERASLLKELTEKVKGLKDEPFPYDGFKKQVLSILKEAGK